MAERNDREEEILEKLRQVLGFSDNSDTADDTDDEPVQETKSSETLFSDNDVKKADKPQNTAAFDTSVFDSSDEPSPYHYDDGLIMFSDTLDRFFETGEVTAQKQKKDKAPEKEVTSKETEDEFRTADFIPPARSAEEISSDTVEREPVKSAEEADTAKQAPNEKNTVRGTAVFGLDDTSEKSKYVGETNDISGDTVERSIEEKDNSTEKSDEPTLRQDTTAADRIAFNRTFTTGAEELSDVDADSYTDAENDIMDSMQQVHNAFDTSGEELDRIFGEGAFSADNQPKTKVKRKEPEKVQPTAEKPDKSLIEFTDIQQRKMLGSRYKAQLASIKKRRIIAIILGIFLLLFESLPAFGVSLPHFMSIDRNPGVYILILLQLFVLIGACALTYLSDGIRSLFKKKIIPETLAAIYCILTLAYGIAICVTATSDNVCPAFFSPCALCVISLLTYRYRTVRREALGFKVVASVKNKYVLESQPLEDTVKEGSDLFEYLPENASAFRISKTQFVNDFVHKSRQTCKDKSALNYILPITSGIFLIALITLLILKKDFGQALTAAFSLFSLIVPSALFAGFSLPFYRCSVNAFENDSAVLGEAAAEEFSTASVISFDDTEVFPSYSAKAGKLATYNDARIDYVIFAAASVFKKLGGPLCRVFNTSKELELTDNVTVVRIEHDGVEAMVDNDNILIGSAAFMERNNLDPVYSVEDEKSEASNNKRVMFIASNGKMSAKMRIKYNADEEFTHTIRQLARTGMCIAIMTFDPNIDTGLLSSEIDINKYPVRVVKCSSSYEPLTVKPQASAEIVSKSSPKALLQTLALCKKVKASIRTNLLSVLLSIVIGGFMGGLILLTNSQSSVNSLWVVIYQIFWILLSYIITFISV